MDSIHTIEGKNNNMASISDSSDPVPDEFIDAIERLEHEFLKKGVPAMQLRQISKEIWSRFLELGITIGSDSMETVDKAILLAHNQYRSQAKGLLN